MYFFLLFYFSNYLLLPSPSFHSDIHFLPGTVALPCSEALLNNMNLSKLRVGDELP